MKKLAVTLLFACSVAHAQFAPNQVLTAVALNSALATPNIIGGTISGLSTPLPVASGGTGLASMSAYGVLIGNGTAAPMFAVPGAAGQVLTSNGPSSAPTWQAPSSSSSGTVTSVQVSGGTTGLTFSGGPVTTSGTITAAGTLAIANGGTGATSQSTALTALLGSSAVPIANGGTNAATAAAAFNNLSPMTTTGDTIYESTPGVAARLPIGTTGQVYTVVSGKPAWATGATSVVPGYINGYTLSNDGTTPNSVLDIAAGTAADSTNTALITGAAFTKSTAGTWVAGSGNNGMGAGLTIAASTWYHVFAIVNNGSFDVYFDTSATAANKPSGTTAFRYIGSFKTDASSHILAFVQNGQYFYYASKTTDISGGGTTSAALYALNVPTGFVVYPIITCTSGAALATVWSPSSTSAAQTSNIYSNGTGYGPTYSTFATNTSAQLYFLISTAGSLSVYTSGYIDPHVANNF